MYIGVGGDGGSGAAAYNVKIIPTILYLLWSVVNRINNYVLSDLMVYLLQLYGIILGLEFLCVAIFILYIRI